MKRFACLMLLIGCAAPTHWSSEQLDGAFGATRLKFTPSDPLSGLHLELVATGEETQGYLVSTSRRLGNRIELKTREQNFSAELPLREGRMKTPLPQAWTEALIQALLNGEEVVMMAGSTEQTIRPEHFSALYKH